MKAFLLSPPHFPEHSDEDARRADKDQETQQRRVQERDSYVLQEADDTRVVKVRKHRQDDHKADPPDH
jgi:hypothetical protein